MLRRKAPSLKARAYPFDGTTGGLLETLASPNGESFRAESD